MDAGRWMIIHTYVAGVAYLTSLSEETDTTTSTLRGHLYLLTYKIHIFAIFTVIFLINFHITKITLKNVFVDFPFSDKIDDK